MPEETGSEKPPGWPIRCWRWIVAGKLDKPLRLLALLAFLAAGAFSVASYPATATAAKNPSYLDNIFATRATLFAARLLVVEAGVFLVFSLVVRTLEGRWATKAGPIETPAKNKIDEAVDDLASWEKRATVAEEEVEALEDRLRATEGDLEVVLRELERAEAKPRWWPWGKT